MGAGRGGLETRAIRGSWAALAALALLAGLVPPAGAATTLRAYVLADATAVDPGDAVTYTVILDNQGPTDAARVWVNLTLPPFTAYDADSGFLPFNCLPLPVVGNRRPYECQNRPQVNESFWVRYRVLAGPADGAVLTATLAVNYTDDVGALQAEVRTTASVTMSIPAFTVTKTPLVNPVDPGDTFSYSITVQNTGSQPASRVWVNDTLPPEVSFPSISTITFPPPPATCTNANCELRNFGMTSETYEIEVTVGTSVPRGIAFANRVFLNFTDDDGSHVVGTGFAEAWVETRVVRDLMLDKTADAALVYPGARVTFTIWYNNTATADLGAAWINDTLPSGLVYNASAPNGTNSGGVVRWAFPSVPVGANAVTLVAVVSSSVANGTVLTNTANADYRDAAGIPGIPVVASTSVTVSTDLPRFDTFAKVADAAEAARGATVRFTIHFNNTGTANATEVVVEDTIPVGTVLTNPSAAPSSQNGRTHTWRFADVPPGTHAIFYDLVLQDVAGGVTILNEARLSYLGPTGQPLPPVPPRSATVRVLAAPPGEGSWIPAAAAVIVLAGVLAFVGYRYLTRPETVIDEVFLLHKDGLLIKHFTRRIRPDVDSDILSGMLIAVQNFVNESFIGSEGLQKEGKLDELRFGEFKMVIERGQWVVVAAVLSGDPTNRVKEEVKASIKDLEAALGTKLDGWAGDMRSVEGADRYMQDLIEGAYRKLVRGKG